MPSQINRSFQIIDAIVLVAATGFGLAGCRFWLWASKTDWDYYWPTVNEPMLRQLMAGSPGGDSDCIDSVAQLDYGGPPAAAPRHPP